MTYKTHLDDGDWTGAGGNREAVLLGLGLGASRPFAPGGEGGAGGLL